jgi:hypothetical protein
MRRLLAVALLAGPLLARAQTAGTIVFSPDARINKTECSAGNTTDEIALAWTITAPDVAHPFRTIPTGEYRVFASASDHDSTRPYCNVTKTGGASSEVTTNPTPLTATSSTMSGVVVKTAALAAAAEKDCSADSTIYVCVLWYEDSGDPDASPYGYAKGTITLKVAAPEKPSVTAVTAGDGALYVKASAPTTGEDPVTWRAKAVDAATSTCVTGTRYSSKVAVGSTARIGGLTNGCPYDVTAYAYSTDGNESPESDPWAGATPQPVEDDWKHYVTEGGRDDGGCQAGAAGLLALLGALGLARLRRRA